MQSIFSSAITLVRSCGAEACSNHHEVPDGEGSWPQSVVPSYCLSMAVALSTPALLTCETWGRDTWGTHGAWVDGSPPNVTRSLSNYICRCKTLAIQILDTGEKRPSASRGQSATPGLERGTSFLSPSRTSSVSSALPLGLLSSWNDCLPFACNPPPTKGPSQGSVSQWSPRYCG